MTVFDSARRAPRIAVAAAVAAGLLMGAAACGQGEPEPEPGSSAPVLGVDNDRVQLLEGTPASVAGQAEAEAVELRLTGYEDGSEPAVVISAQPRGGEATEYTLRLGDHLEAGGSSWRVSEIGISGSQAQPASVTLTREPA
ncbi:DUF6406 domain-containing protein [Streptomonospora litoralis]|uniref:Lipoprotein n=1 Tax=Streptomonospora litoralis TaxID=2498135 RepID=A0A4P6Q810_9ACTN|nr:DUF6406 domain-containing protein [Streptomonospora litoralis]QBI55299.1 hypothetical protein EKD16_17655 [Streptomonospora litoralis]